MSKTSDLTTSHALTKDVDELHDRISKEVGISEAKHARADRRHAELAALVAELAVALETLEMKVRKLDGFYGVSDRVKPGIDPPDIKDVPAGPVDWVRGPRPDAPRGPRGGLS